MRAALVLAPLLALAGPCVALRVVRNSSSSALIKPEASSSLAVDSTALVSSLEEASQAVPLAGGRVQAVEQAPSRAQQPAVEASSSALRKPEPPALVAVEQASLAAIAIMATDPTALVSLGEESQVTPPADYGSASLRTVTAPYAALPFTALLVGGVILFIYGPRGTRVVFSVLIYVTALSTMKLTVKWVFVTHSYQFAKFLSGLHFLTGGIVTGLLLVSRRSLPPAPTKSEFWGMIFPIALSVAASIGANNMALVFCSAAFTEIIAATSCLITIVMVILMGMPFDLVLILPALVVVIGCAMSTAGELNFSLVGMMLCFLATVCRSLKVAMQQKLMTGETRDKFDPCTLLFWTCAPSTVVMLLASLLTEGLAPYQAFVGREPGELMGLVTAVAASCMNATILNLAQLFVTKDLGAVGSQLVAQAKMVLTVLGGMVLFGEVMTRIEVAGFGLALVGVWSFSQLEQRGKAKAAKAMADTTSLSPCAAPSNNVGTAARTV